MEKSYFWFVDLVQNSKKKKKKDQIHSSFLNERSIGSLLLFTVCGTDSAKCFSQWLDAKVMMGVLNYRDYIEYIFHLIGKSGSQSVDSKSGKSRFT